MFRFFVLAASRTAIGEALHLAPRCAQRPPKGPTRPRDGSRDARDGPGRTQDSPKSSKEWPTGRLREAPGGPKAASEHP
eukprot:5998267-Pyramimonas_sp.AAC.1